MAAVREYTHLATIQPKETSAVCSFAYFGRKPKR